MQYEAEKIYTLQMVNKKGPTLCQKWKSSRSAQLPTAKFEEGENHVLASALMGSSYHLAIKELTLSHMKKN